MAGLAICSGGCCSFQQFVDVMQRLDHRCCPTGLCPTGLLDAPQIISEPIGQGAPGSLVALEIAGVSSKTAVDASIELKDKLNELQNDNQRLRSDLRLANRTIEKQQVTMNRAAAELESTRLEFERVQTEMNDWREKLSRLDARFRMDKSRFHTVMAGMEKRLESMLSQCSGDLDMATNPVTDAKLSHPNSVEFSDPDDLRIQAPFNQPTEARGRTP